MKYYPVGLRLKGKDVLVVGAGIVAERKIRTLRAFGAFVRVVAPQATAHIKRLALEGRIRWFKRSYRSSDIRGSRLVIIATSDRGVNEKAAQDAKKIGVWANVVDRTAVCEFIAPAVIRKKGLVLAISTDAKNPPLSKRFREFLEERVDEFFSGRYRP